MLQLSAQEPSGLDKTWPKEKQISWLFNLRKPYEPKELKTRFAAFAKDFKENKTQLAKVTNMRSREAYAISNHILLAAYKKDASFQYMLKEAEIRKEFGHIDLALCVYDYQLNKSKPALNQLLAQLATEPMGYDSTVIVMIAVIDEWDLTVKAYKKHFYRTDGAGGSCMRHFKEKREVLYPEQYKKTFGPKKPVK